jgi:hypothetical protein
MRWVEEQRELKRKKKDWRQEEGMQKKMGYRWG